MRLLKLLKRLIVDGDLLRLLASLSIRAVIQRIDEYNLHWNRALGVRCDRPSDGCRRRHAAVDNRWCRLKAIDGVRLEKKFRWN